MADGPSRQKRLISAELIIPVMALAFTGYYFTTILDSPWTAQVNFFLIGSLLTATILVFFGVLIREMIAGRARLGFGDFMEPRSLLPTRLAFIGLTVGYLVVIEWLGFTLTTFLYLSLSMILLNRRRRPATDITVAAAMAVVGYLVFLVAFETRLPAGPVERFFGTLL